MKKLFVVLFVLAAAGVFGQQKYALVIGNGNYASIQRLANPVNDATDIAAKLRSLGYQVDLQTNVGNAAMGRVINAFTQRLAGNKDNEGFFWYAGHAVQMDGENYLLPVDVDTTDDVSVKYSSYPVNRLIDSFERTARNKVNVVVLDACRDNPFRNMTGRHRNLSRGITVLHDLPPDLFVIYSTGPGDVAADGAAGKRNSPFAEAFLKNMDSSEDLSIVVRSITRETLRLTDNKQRPYQDGSIISMDYYSLNPRKNPPPVATAPVQPTPTPAPAVQPTPAPRPTPTLAPTVQPAAPPQNPVSGNFVRINGGTFTMGSPAGEPGRESNEGPQHQVTVSSFYMGKYEVTQKEWYDVMGTTVRQQREKAGGSNLYGEGDNYPMYYVSWLEAVEYCNKRSQREGLTSAYTINGTNVTWNRNANGYRLPTEAEWEYACRAGTTTAYNTGASISDSTGWYGANSGSTSHPVGQKPANRWGLHDMHGNVWEWCWDWYGTYPSGAQTDPTGASSGSHRVFRGGSWDISAEDVRSVRRIDFIPSSRYYFLGFRLARNGN